MKSFVSKNFKSNNFLKDNLLNYFPTPQSLTFSTKKSFSTFNKPSIKEPKFNILFFCPRNEEHLNNFNDEYPKFIKSANPDSVSVTDVAHNPENNSRAIKLLLNNQILPEMIIPHLVLIGHDKEDADQKIKFFRDSGIKSIFAVRGNPMVLGKDKDYTHHPQGYEDMKDLMYRIKELAPDMKIIVAGYPGKHPYAKSFDEDLDELKKKVDYGADSIVTQHFFDNEVFLTFLDQCQKRKIELPVIPSILPIGNPKYLFSFSKAANVDVPAEIIEILFKEGSVVNYNSITDKDVEKKAIEYTSKQIQSLIDLKLPQVPKINTYTANNIPFLKKVFENLGLELKKDSEKTR